MPLADRDYVRGEHPPTCTCMSCERRRANGTRGFAHTAEVLKSTITVTSTHGNVPVAKRVSVLKGNPSGVERLEDFSPGCVEERRSIYVAGL